MGFKSSPLLCLAIFLAVSSAVHALDITKLLGQYPDLAAFNKYLTETKLADQINSRNTITILAVNDGALGGLSGKSPQAIKAALSVHVILDYFDEKKLADAIGANLQLTTLYQASGLAVNDQGFIKVALIGEGAVAFGSAVKGAKINAELVKTVTTIPYNVSVLQIARLIDVPAINAQAPQNPSANAPLPAHGAKAPAHAAQTPKVGQTPPPTEEVSAPSPVDEVVVEAPVDAPTTTPVSSPSLAPSPVAADEATTAPPPKSSSSRTTISLVGAIMVFASLLVAL